jgi:hypothetical protein
VVAVEDEVPGVIERRRLPGAGLVTGLAGAADLAVQPVGRRAVAALAAFEHGRGQQLVVEVRRPPGLAQLHDRERPLELPGDVDWRVL